VSAGFATRVSEGGLVTKGCPLSQVDCKKKLALAAKKLSRGKHSTRSRQQSRSNKKLRIV